MPAIIPLPTEITAGDGKFKITTQTGLKFDSANKDVKRIADQVVKEIKRRTRRTFTAEEKIKIVLEAMRGEDTIAAICRKYAIHANNYFNWIMKIFEISLYNHILIYDLKWCKFWCK